MDETDSPPRRQWLSSLAKGPGETPFRVFAATRSKRKRGLHRAAPIFNPAVSKVKFPQSNLSTRLGAKKVVGAAGDDFCNPPLDRSTLSFSDDFSVISGVPVFTFKADADLDSEEDLHPARIQKLTFTTSSRASVGRVHTGMEESQSSPAFFPKAKFRSAAVAVALATKIAGKKKPVLPKRLSYAVPSSAGIHEGRSYGAPRTRSLPNVRQNHFSSSETHSPNFFTSRELQSPILCSVFDIEGAHMASGHGNGVVRVWNTQHGCLSQVLKKGHKCAVIACQFIPNNMLASCDISGMLIIWKLDASPEDKEWPKKYSLEMDLPDADIIIVVPEFSANGRYIALRPLHESSEIYQKLSSIRGGRDSMPVLPQHDSVHIAVWDTWELPGSLENPIELEYDAQGFWDHNLQVREVKFLDHGANCGLTVCIQDEYRDYHGFNNIETAVLVWPSLAQPEDVAVLDGMLASGSPSLSLIATWNPKAKWGPARGACFLWDMRHFTKSKDSGKEEQETTGGLGRTPDSSVLRDCKKDTIYWCAFANENNLITSIHRDSLKILVWDVALAAKLFTFETGLEACSPVCSIHLPDQWLSLFAPDCSVGFVWNITSGIEVLKLGLPEGRSMGSDAWSSFFAPKTCKLASVSMQEIIVWNSRVFEKHRGQDGTSFLVHNEPDRNVQMKRCRLSLDGSVIAIEIFMYEGKMSLLDVWNMTDGTVITLPQDRTVGSSEIFHGIVAFNLSNTGHRVITWGADNRGICWDIHTHKVKVVSKFKGPQGCTVIDCCFVGNDAGSGQAMVACLKEGTLLWWEGDVEIGQISLEPILSCQFSPNGSQAVLMFRDMKTVHVWDLMTRTLVYSTKYRMELRQMNKPAVGEAWPLSLSLDGKSAFVGLEKDTYFPLFAKPTSTLAELKDKVGLVANSVAFSKECRALVLSDFTDIFVPEITLEGDVSCIWVMNALGRGEIRELCGSEGAIRSMSISGNGRTIACISGGATLTVWGPYASRGCIPDFHQILQSPMLKLISIEHLDDQEEIVLKQIFEEFGPRIINYPDCYGLSLFMHAVILKKISWLKLMIDMSKECSLKIGLQRQKNSFSTERMNAMQQAIQLRSPEVLDLLIEAMLDGLVTSQEISSVLGDSLLDLLVVYPSTFLKIISDARLLWHQGEVMVPENAFQDSALVVTSSDTAHPPIDRVGNFWRQYESEALEEPVDGQDYPCIFKKIIRYFAPPKAQGSVKVKALAKFVPYPDLAQVGSKGILRRLLASKAPIQVYGTVPIRGVIQLKWKAYGKRIMVHNLAFYGINLLIFTLYSVFLGLDGKSDDDDNSDKYRIAATAMLFLTSPLSFWKLCRLVRQFLHLWRDELHGPAGGLKYWLFSGYHILEGVTLFLVSIVTPVMHYITEVPQDNGTLSKEEMHGLVAALSILLWWNMLYYILPFRHTGPLVLIIQEIMKDMLVFIVLVVTVLAGFTVAFFVLFNHSDCRSSDPDKGNNCKTEAVEDAFGTLDRSFVTTFGMMLGEFETAWFYDASQSIVPIVLWVLYMMIMMVILLNLLIAVMGATFQKVIQTEEVHFLRIKARVIDDMETIISRSRQKDLQERIGAYLHILVPAHLSDNSFRMANQLLTGTWQKSFSDMVSAGVESMEAKIAKVTATQAGLWQHQENIGSNQATILSELHTLKQSLHKLTAALPTSNTDPPAEA